jgi:Fur family ferric uptake transcriptional regulator
MERRTRQRDAILRTLRNAGSPLSPPEILKGAGRLKRGLGLATVYRTLKSLRDEELISEVQLPGQPPRFELSGKRHHHHFECRTCGKVYEIEGCPRGLSRLAPRGMRVERHELTLYGRCAACAG